MLCEFVGMQIDAEELNSRGCWAQQGWGGEGVEAGGDYQALPEGGQS